MKNLIEEFKKFAMRGNAIDLAVGVVIGAAFNQITTSLANDVLTPPLGILLGGIDFANLAFPISPDVAIRYGALLQAIINFLLIALALFLLVKGINRLMARTKKEEEQKPPAPSEELTVLREIRDELKKR